MADEDSQCRTDQETSGAFDLSEIFLRNLYSHGGLVSPSTPVLKRVITFFPPSAKMVWASLPDLGRLIEPFDG